jgi:glucokinase
MIGATMIGIDLGGTNCRGAVVSAEGEIGESRRMATRIEDGGEIFLGRLVDFGRSLVELAAAGGAAAAALGMGVPGIIAADGTVTVSPNLPPLNGVHLAAHLSAELGLPVTIVNDANAIAWGEALFGAGRSLPSFLTITLGTGVGGGLVCGGRLWEGADGAAGEIGHMTVEPDGRPCGCGNRGCVEQYASASGIVGTVRELLACNPHSSLAGLPMEELNSHVVALAAECGDPVAIAAFREAGLRLGQVLAGVTNLLNLDGVVITGGASESLDLMRPALEEEIARRACAVPARRLQIVRGALGDDAGILGAARLALGRAAGQV